VHLYIDCLFEAFGNKFTMNSALKGKGGAIFHDKDLDPPDLLSNKFKMNTAKEYMSYIQYPKSFSLISLQKPILKVKSGRVLEDSLILGIIDKNNQWLWEESKNMVSIANDN
jgi:hypothetical protein